MGRPKNKEWRSFSIRMDAELYDALSDYCTEAGQSKTTAVEKSVKLLIEDYNKKNNILKAALADK